jgi:hypothetical protein
VPKQPEPGPGSATLGWPVVGGRRQRQELLASSGGAGWGLGGAQTLCPLLPLASRPFGAVALIAGRCWQWVPPWRWDRVASSDAVWLRCDALMAWNRGGWTATVWQDPGGDGSAVL